MSFCLHKIFGGMELRLVRISSVSVAALLSGPFSYVGVTFLNLQSTKTVFDTNTDQTMNN